MSMPFAGTVPRCLISTAQVSSIAGTGLDSTTSNIGDNLNGGSGGSSSTTLAWAIPITLIGALLLGVGTTMWVMRRRLAFQKKQERRKLQVWQHYEDAWVHKCMHACVAGRSNHQSIHCWHVVSCVFL